LNFQVSSLLKPSILAELRNVLNKSRVGVISSRAISKQLLNIQDGFALQGFPKYNEGITRATLAQFRFNDLNHNILRFSYNKLNICNIQTALISEKSDMSFNG
jgi:hypothetical protein